MTTLTKLDEVKDLLEQHQGVVTLDMVVLRDAHGAGRLGNRVCTAISNKLNGLGVGHFPDPLPENQWDSVRLYRLGTPIAELIDAVLTPSEEHDEELRGAAGGEDAAVLRRIRELVCK